MSEPAWLGTARRHLGVAEIPGKEHAPQIQGWLINLKAWWRDDETPWCGVFVAECMRETHIALPQHWYRAKGWLDWGQPTVPPSVGSVVVFERTGGGHVGLVVGRDQYDSLMVIGGNQGNRVSIAPFARGRVVGYRWPREIRLPPLGRLPLVNSDGQLSTQES